MNSAPPPAYVLPAEASTRLSQMGNNMRFTDPQLKGLHKLPKEIIINRILPFVGGVREKESQKTQLLRRLLQQLKDFMCIANDTIFDWFNSRCLSQNGYPVIRIHTISNVVYNDFWRNKWSNLKSQIDNTLYQGGHREYSKYRAAELNLTTLQWLQFWVDFDEILISEFIQVDLPTWLFYAEIYRPKLLFDQN